MSTWHLLSLLSIDPSLSLSLCLLFLEDAKTTGEQQQMLGCNRGRSDNLMGQCGIWCDEQPDCIKSKPILHFIINKMMNLTKYKMSTLSPSDLWQTPKGMQQHWSHWWKVLFFSGELHLSTLHFNGNSQAQMFLIGETSGHRQERSNVGEIHFLLRCCNWWPKQLPLFCLCLLLTALNSSSDLVVLHESYVVEWLWGKALRTRYFLVLFSCH